MAFGTYITAGTFIVSSYIGSQVSAQDKPRFPSTGTIAVSLQNDLPTEALDFLGLSINKITGFPVVDTTKNDSAIVSYKFTPNDYGDEKGDVLAIFIDKSHLGQDEPYTGREMRTKHTLFFVNQNPTDSLVDIVRMEEYQELEHNALPYSKNENIGIYKNKKDRFELTNKDKKFPKPEFLKDNSKSISTKYCGLLRRLAKN